MIILLSIYICIYGTAHLYYLVKARRAYYLQGVGYVLLSAVLLFLLLAPIQGRILEAQGHVWPAMIVTWIGYTWMGFLFLFVCLSLPLDIYHLCVGAGQHLTGGDWTGLMLSRRQSLSLATIAAIGLMAYGAYEAYGVETRRVGLTSDKIPAAAKRIRIVQVSDLHLGLMTYPGKLTPIIKAIEQAKPDILVSTGDLVDGHVFKKKEIVAKLNSIQAPMGKYAVTGNHEFYLKSQYGHAFTRAAGFKLLENSAIAIKDWITVIGVDDPAKGEAPSSGAAPENELLGQAPKKGFRVLLKHRPLVSPESKGRFDLQLSGHTHHGQIVPFGLLVSLRYPMENGLIQLPEGGHLYVSKGTGTWGPPIRLLARPEITIIDLIARP